MHRNELGDMSLAQMGSVGVTTWFHAGSSTATTATPPTNAAIQPSASSIAPANANVARGYYRADIISWHLSLFSAAVVCPNISLNLLYSSHFLFDISSKHLLELLLVHRLSCAKRETVLYIFSLDAPI